MNRRIRPYFASGLVCAALAATVSGCAVGPEYRQHELVLPADWSTQAGRPRDKLQAEAIGEWWTLFEDPILADLIEKAVANNPDRRRSLARVREARAQRGVAHAGFFPSLGASGSASSSRKEGVVEDAGWNEAYAVGVDASWEIDVFGGLTYSAAAADANLQAREADYFDVLTSLTAEVAFAYVDIRTLQERLRITKESQSAQEETFDLTRWRAEAGLSTMLDVEQARTSLAGTKAQIPALTSDLSSKFNLLSNLIGEAPGALETRVLEAAPVPRAPDAVAAGVPADLLRRRPDIRSAERDLAAQSARTGIAVADLYPSFQLTGSITSSSNGVTDLFSADSLVETIAAGLTAPIFNAGRLRSNVEKEDAVYEQALASYESRVLSALGEVEDALAANAAARQRSVLLEDAVKAAQRAYQLALQQYQAGLTEFDQVLDAQRTLLSQEDSLVQSSSAETVAMISLYKALGGGWSD